jgi:hypothetical protein
LIASAAISVTAVGGPPWALTRDSPRFPKRSLNRIVPSGLQVAPRPSSATQIFCALPPSRATFRSSPPAKKPIEALSGDQNG